MCVCVCVCVCVWRGEGVSFWSNGQPGDDLSCYTYLANLEHTCGNHDVLFSFFFFFSDLCDVISVCGGGGRGQFLV